MLDGGRINLKGWQQAAVALGSAFGALLDPRRADLIAALGETTGKPAFERVLERMKKNPEGRAILLERPRVISANVGHAWDLPDNTFGAAYARFMGSRNFSPDDRPPVRFMDTDELAYVAMRAREVHDFWHTLFGLNTNLIGESALKVIELEQMLLPMCLLSVIGGTARFNDKQRKLFFQHYLPWATRAGLRCTDLISIYYERHFHEDLEDVRRRWGIIPAPVLPKLPLGNQSPVFIPPLQQYSWTRYYTECKSRGWNFNKKSWKMALNHSLQDPAFTQKRPTPNNSSRDTRTHL